MKNFFTNQRIVNLHDRLLNNRGFTLIEVLVASTLLGFALIVMFGMHAQALRSNMHAKKMTDCAYLAQSQMEHLLQRGWLQGNTPSVLANSALDATTGCPGGSPPQHCTGMWVDMEHTGASSGYPAAILPSPTYGPKSYSLTWDVLPMDTSSTWMRLRVRCSYTDNAFLSKHGTTISNYRFRDN